MISFLNCVRWIRPPPRKKTPITPHWSPCYFFGRWVRTRTPLTNWFTFWAGWIMISFACWFSEINGRSSSSLIGWASCVRSSSGGSLGGAWLNVSRLRHSSRVIPTCESEDFWNSRPGSPALPFQHHKVNSFLPLFFTALNLACNTTTTRFLEDMSGLQHALTYLTSKVPISLIPTQQRGTSRWRFHLGSTVSIKIASARLSRAVSGFLHFKLGIFRGLSHVWLSALLRRSRQTFIKCTDELWRWRSVMSTGTYLGSLCLLRARERSATYQARLAQSSRTPSVAPEAEPGSLQTIFSLQVPVLMRVALDTCVSYE